MTWEHISSIIGIVLFLATIITYSVRITKAATENTMAIKQLTETMRELTRENKQEHNEIYDRLENHDRQLIRHDSRIKYLEEKE